MLGVSELPDEMIASAVRGSSEAVARVAEALSPQVRVMVMARLTATPQQFHAVEDIAQQVLAGVTVGLGGLQNVSMGGLRAYTSRVVANKVADYLRRAGAHDGARAKARSLDSTVAGATEAAPLWAFLSATGTSPSGVAYRAELFRSVAAELGRLKAEHREVITLAFFDQLPTGEIAGRMGISRPAASMLLIRAVKTLRRRVTGSSEPGAFDHVG